MEKKLTTAEFDSWAEALIEYQPNKLYAVFRKYNIADMPTPQTIMLGAIANGQPFIDDLNEIGIPPAKMNLKADGSGLTDFFQKALGAATTIVAAKEIFAKKTDSQTKQTPPPEEEETFEIFGKKIPKIYVYASMAFAAVVGAYLYFRK